MQSTVIGNIVSSQQLFTSSILECHLSIGDQIVCETSQQEWSRCNYERFSTGKSCSKQP